MFYQLLEAFGSGTAAIVSPVNGFNYKGVDYPVPIDAEKGAGDVCYRVLNMLQEVYVRKIS
jgi:hypothetical protein